MGLPGGPRPKNQDGGVRVSVLHTRDKNHSACPGFPVYVIHNCSHTSCLPSSLLGTDQETSREQGEEEQQHPNEPRTKQRKQVKFIIGWWLLAWSCGHPGHLLWILWQSIQKLLRQATKNSIKLTSWWHMGKTHRAHQNPYATSSQDYDCAKI